MYFPSSDQMSTEMKYKKEQIEREERKLDQYRKKLEFETQEQLKREEQIDRRQSEELKKLEADLAREVEEFRSTKVREMKIKEDKIKRTHSELQRLSSELESERQEFERQQKVEKKTDEHDRVRNNSHNDFERMPDALRIKHDSEKVKRDLEDLLRNYEYEKNQSKTQELTLERNNKREIEKMRSQHEREKNGFEDAWKRGEKFLREKVETAERMINRLKTEYESEAREYKIELRRTNKSESEHRARFGDEDANKNFASSDDVSMEDVTENFNQSKSKRRVGGARW